MPTKQASFVIAMLVVACGASDSAGTGSGAPAAGAGGAGGASGAGGAGGQAKALGAQVLYGPQKSTRLTPYPSNRYTVVDPTAPTGLRVALSADTTAEPSIATYPTTTAELNQADGFSTVGGVAVHFAGKLDPSSFARDVDGFGKADAPLVLVDVDPASPDFGRSSGLIVRYYPTTLEDDGLPDDFALVAQPARPLRPRTRYLFVVTDALRDAAMLPVSPSDETRALVSGVTKDEYADSVRAALPTLTKSTGVDPSRVALATVFTTESVIDDLAALAAARRMTGAPPLKDIAVDPSKTEPGNKDRVRFKGHYPSPEYRAPKPDGKWHLQGGVPVPQAAVDLEFNLDVTDASKVAKRPVVFFAHGLNGDKDGTWGTAERLSSLGVAVIGIDSPEHGTRNADPKNSFPTFSFFGIDAATASFDIGQARDNFRQMAADQLELVRLLDTLATLDVMPVGAPDGVPDLDVSRVLYIGHSFGSVQGPTILALAPEIRAATWNVGGDDVTTLLRESNTFKLLVKGFEPAGTTDGDLARFFVMIQAIMDPGDPINFAKYGALEPFPGVGGWKPRSVLLQEVVNDSIVPNITSELLARAAGLALVAPVKTPIGGLETVAAPASGNVANGAATCGIFQFDTADGMVAQHGGLIFSKDAMSQYVPFFKGALAGGPGVIINPYAP